jgi:myosin-5
MLERWHLSSNIETYQFLSHSSCTSISGVSDEDDFARTRECMRSISIEEPAQDVIFGLVAAVLHLGNVQFEKHPTEEHVRGIASHTAADSAKAAALMGLSEDSLQRSMCQKTMNVGAGQILRDQELHQVCCKPFLCQAIVTCCIAIKGSRQARLALQSNILFTIPLDG